MIHDTKKGQQDVRCDRRSTSRRERMQAMNATQNETQDAIASEWIRMPSQNMEHLDAREIIVNGGMLDRMTQELSIPTHGIQVSRQGHPAEVDAITKISPELRAEVGM